MRKAILIAGGVVLCLLLALIGVATGCAIETSGKYKGSVDVPWGAESRPESR